MSQSGLGSFASGLLARPGNYAVVRRVREAAQRISSGLGVDLDLFGARPGELDDDVGVLRYQYSTTFDYFTNRGSRGDTDIGQVQFRTTLYTLADPSDEVKEYIKGVNHLRLHALFDTGKYKGYMTGFEFIDRSENEEEGELVGRDEIPATGLGVPNFSCEVYDEDGQLVGHSTGYSMDFGVHQQDTITGDDAPEGEVWQVRSFNQSRGDYEVSPDARTPARERAKGAQGKTVYINGAPVGSVTSRGTVWLTKEHQRPGAATYRSRKWLTDNTSTPYQALSPGSQVYKVNETGDGLYFSTVKPRDFDAVAAEQVDEDATQTIETEAVMDLDEDEPTTFVVTEDEADEWALGKRNLTQTVEVERKQDWRANTMRGAR